MQPLVITSTHVTPYRKPFQKPFTINGKEISVREGLILTVQAGAFKGQGEIAPLEGISPETFKKAKHDLSVIGPQLKNSSLPDVETPPRLAVARQQWGASLHLNLLRNFQPLQGVCPSVRFGVESAMVDLVCNVKKITLVELLVGADHARPLQENTRDRSLQTAVLLQGSNEQIVQETKNFASHGYKVFKLKVGSRNIPLDVKKVVQLRQIIPQDALIRLDANRAWSIKEAVLFGQLIGLEHIEFIEEPLKDMKQIEEFYLKTGLHVALDESLTSATPEVEKVVKAYVLKPTVLGGISVTLDWIERAKSLGKKAIISSCFESKIGLKVLKNLALLTNEVPGLGTEHWFK